jgi:DNA-binding CsgD family transcriptional regulator
MASALTAVLAPQEIAARLEQSVDLLTRGYRTARLRHHSLRASLVHSVSALSGPARALLRSLGVFPGEFTLDAVEAVCAPPRAETGGRPLIDVLAELVDKHLVLRSHDWFRLTAPARLDARARLCRDGGWPEAVAAHAAWCARLADRIGASLGTGAAAATLPLLDRNSTNLLAALRAADETADPAGPAAIAAVLVRYWLRHDCAHRFRGGRGPALPSQADSHTVDDHTADGQTRDFTLARRWIERAADSGLLPDDSRTPERLGVLSALEGDFPRARWLLNIAVERAGASRRGREATSVRCSLAVAVLLDPAPADPPLSPEAELEAARTQYRARRDALGEAFAAVWLALAAARTDPAGRAPEAIAAACGLVADSGDEALAAALTGARATVELARGEPARALELAGAEAAAWERIGVGAVRSGPVLDPALAEAWQALGAAAALRHWERGISGSPAEAGLPVREAHDTAGARPRSEREALALLSPRELEVVRRVARGQTSARIAKEFVISPRTVDTHVDHVRTKLGLHSRAEVAAWAASLGIA